MRPIRKIAQDIRMEWKNVYFGAKPYLSAMMTMETVKDDYGLDSGDSIVRYFLANAATFRGGRAKELKAELQAHLKA